MAFQPFGTRHLTDERPWSNPDHDITADIRNFALTQCGAPFVGWDSPKHPAFIYHKKGH